MIAQAVSAEGGNLAALGRALIATVLVFAAAAKLRDWSGFRTVMRFVAGRAPRLSIEALAVGVVGLEAALAGMLATGIAIEAATWGTVGFLCAATLALLVLRRRGYEGGCACFGERSATGSVGWLDFGRNAVLIAVALAVARSSAAAPPLWDFSAAVIGLGAATTAGMLLTYAMTTAIVAVRGATGATGGERTLAVGRSADEGGARRS